jgi:predicted transcriptional regulator
MSDRETRTVSLQPENDEYLKQQDNASAIVDDLITQLREGGDKTTAVVETQIEEKKLELEEARNRVERLERGLQDLRELRDSMQSQESAELQQAREALEDTPKEPTNDAVQHWAEKLGMAPQELLQQLR